MAAKKPQSPKPAKVKAGPASLPPTSQKLAGQVAVVTGGSQGIGYAIARVFAAEGCSVVITGRDKKKLAQAKATMLATLPRITNSKVFTQVCDVREPASVDALFATVKEHFARIDILVNNAGVAQPLTPIEQIDLALWREVMDTNLTGLFLCTRAALPLMGSGGTIVNNLSVAAMTVFPNFAAYNASKHGALGFSLSLREELMPKGIRVVALMAGATDTAIWQQFWPDAPRERMIDVESVARAVLYAALLPPNANLSQLVLSPTFGAL